MTGQPFDFHVELSGPGRWKRSHQVVVFPKKFVSVLPEEAVGSCGTKVNSRLEIIVWAVSR
jgi:hypothetical protein